jgi:ABC-2 type transport system ATP-binding protein
MWRLVRGLRESGVTIILTTHYIDEAEEMADRIGVINRGEIVLVEDKLQLMQRFSRRQLTLQLQQPLQALPPELGHWQLELAAGGQTLVHRFGAASGPSDVGELLRRLAALGIGFKDLQTEQSSLEDIFVSLVGKDAA